MRKDYVAIGMLFFLTFSFCHVQDAIADHEIVGTPKCKACHKKKTGDQWKIWSESAHARAFETLASEASRKIASERGLGDPQTEEACLKCHVTKASIGNDAVVAAKAKYSDSEGVGCEACHGPGSDYKAKKIMKDPEAARAAGLIVITGEEGCTQCHNEDSPTYKGFDFEARMTEIAHPVPGDEEDKVVSSAERTMPSAIDDIETPEIITYKSSVGDVRFTHDEHVKDEGIECVECHHQIHAKNLDTPHPDYMTSSWVSCKICHDENSDRNKEYYKCADCHLTDVADISDETLSSKVVTHKSCWNCHETGTGIEASKGCAECHVKKEK